MILGSRQRNRWIPPCIGKKPTVETGCSTRPGGDIFETRTLRPSRLSLLMHLSQSPAKTSSPQHLPNMIFQSEVKLSGWLASQSPTLPIMRSMLEESRPFELEWHYALDKRVDVVGQSRFNHHGNRWPLLRRPRRTRKRTSTTAFLWCASPRNAYSASATNANLTKGGRLSTLGPTRWWMRLRDTWKGLPRTTQFYVLILGAPPVNWCFHMWWRSKITLQWCTRSCCVRRHLAQFLRPVHSPFTRWFFLYRVLCVWHVES